MKERLPRAMVLVHDPRAGASTWCDFISRARTLNGLTKQLKRGVMSGDYVAWRLIRIEKEVYGNAR